MSHFSPFDVGQIKAHAYHGLSADRIAEILVKPKRGPGRKKLHWTEGAVQRIINKLEDEPGWRGEREEGSGATRKTTKSQDLALYNALIKSRGKYKVTVPWLRRKFPWLQVVHICQSTPLQYWRSYV